MPDRRTFLLRAAGAVGATAVVPTAWAEAHAAADALRARVERALAHRPGVDARALAHDDAFWAEVRGAYDLHPAILNLDHGWTNPAPRASMGRLVQHALDLEALPAERLLNLWTEITNSTVRGALAGILGVPGDQLAFVRNATEALDTVLLGVPLGRGDEVVCAAHDYFAMLDALDQRAARDGVVLRRVELPVPAPSLDALADLYTAALTPRTRLVLLTHPSNLTGQLLPVRRIADAAHRVGAEVVVDGAQSLGLVAESPADLGADYYGASLHKWLGAPVGMGVLWMRPEHTARVWPLVPSPRGTPGMARYEWIGTSTDYVGPAVLPALALHTSLGTARKAARLRTLTAALRDGLRARLPGVRFYADDAPEATCGLCTFELPGHDAARLKDRLLAEHAILVQAMTGIPHAPHIRGLRVSPNVYTTPAELARFVEALAAVARA